MRHPFLSEDWFTEVEKLRDEAPEPAAAAKDLLINIVVSGGPEGDKEVHLNAGQFERGLADNAPTKVTVPFDIAKAMFVEGNPQAGMQAFMSGQIKVEGDMSKLMAMQQAAEPDPAAAEAAARIQAITE